MPTNRKKRTRVRTDLDSDKIGEQFYGPGTCLFNGCGYAGGYYKLWDQLTPEQKSEVRNEMERDWRASAHVIMAAWNNRSDHEIDIAEQYEGGHSEPWARREFGDPQ